MLQRFMDYLLTILIFWFLINRKINLTLDWLSAAIGIQGCVFFVLLMFILQFLVKTHFVIVTTKDEGMTSLKSTSLELISKDGDMLI